ncbi:hypothetical protein KDX23_03335 [Burkholderia vietnamiensis]|uniref:hypothetical protein n=1 Tax=Burkholderia vietnamiensis TaxID=60552 RepID=UPI001B9AED01|nr:hypothetical protein [Burkholderia vietnamiensis]MBR8081773.1 hypothetical protein [Burkholderia vietnamiensis]
MSVNNLSKEKENVNNEEKKTIQNPFVQVPLKAINELMLKKPALFQLLVYMMANHMTFKYGLIGVHHELTQSAIAKELKIDRKNAIRFIENLQSLGYIKIYHKTPLIMQVQNIEGIDTIKDISTLISLISNNTNDFNLPEYGEWKRILFKMLTDLTNEDIFGYAPFTS